MWKASKFRLMGCATERLYHRKGHMTDLLKTKLIKKGEVLFREGEDIENFFIVSHGRIALLKKNNSRQVIVKVCEEKEMAGEDCAFGASEVYTYSALALDDSEVMAIDAKLALDSVNEQKSWVQSILENLSGKVENTSDLISEHKIEDDALYGKAGLHDEDLAFIKSSLS